MLSADSAHSLGDVLVGAPGDDNTGADAGMARVLSGANGQAIYTFDGAAAGDGFGSAVAGIGDADADGAAELLIGAPGSDAAATDAGEAVVLDGATGAVRYRMRGALVGDAFGAAVASGGDLDADGRLDFAVGMPGSDLGGVDAGAARTFSGATGAAISTVLGEGLGDKVALHCAGEARTYGQLHARVEGLADHDVRGLAGVHP